MTEDDPVAQQSAAQQPDAEQVEHDGEDLRASLGELACTVSDSLPVSEMLSRVAGLATNAIPGVDGAGITVLRAVQGTPQVESWGAPAEFVQQIDRIQYELLNEGPCLTCMHEQQPVVSGSLGSDARWPRFGGRVARLGVHSALSLPLVVGDRVIGAINAYARTRDAFGEHAVRLGGLFAGPAAVSVHNAQLLAATASKAEQLQAALTSRAVIDQAIGILRSRSGGTAEEAFDRLRQISQGENVKVSLVAQRLVDEAVRRAHARHSTG
jgi:GAF domain-containing protein